MRLLRLKGRYIERLNHAYNLERVFESERFGVVATGRIIKTATIEFTVKDVCKDGIIVDYRKLPDEG
jgi:hypothetical protein